MNVTSILTAQPKQISLKDDGALYFQIDPTNPLPGQPIAKLEKGETLLQPALTITDDSFSDAASQEHITSWLKAHIYTVLEPLMNLVSDDALTGSARDIAFKLFQNLGVVARQDIESDIQKLDTDARKLLRTKKVKLGPLLAFLPDLNKPAAIRLRALLHSLYHDKSVPAFVPRDGAVSITIDAAAVDTDLLRVIGYPVYGPRAIRIDMLDRVISAVYDSAKDGRFRPTHTMAEWMGCPIADLYAILQAMGHKHIPSPALEIKEVVTSEEKTDIASEESKEPLAETPKAKPLLDEFILRRGKAHQERVTRPEMVDRKERAPRVFTKPDRVKADGKADDKFFNRPESDNFKKKTKLVREDNDRQSEKRAGKFDHKHKKDHDKNREPRVFSAEAKQDDNPFAVLLQLKGK
jgi:ATP-dependent RNA helicase SUPV3L1/SUV3